MEVLRRVGRSVGPYGIAGGQAMDLECEKKTGVTLKELEWIHLHKTAALLKVSHILYNVVVHNAHNNNNYY